MRVAAHFGVGEAVHPARRAGPRSGRRGIRKRDCGGISASLRSSSGRLGTPVLAGRAGDRRPCLLGSVPSKDAGLHRIFKNKAKARIRIRILLGDPESRVVAERGDDEGIVETVSEGVAIERVLGEPIRGQTWGRYATSTIPLTLTWIPGNIIDDYIVNDWIRELAQRLKSITEILGRNVHKLDSASPCRPSCLTNRSISFKRIVEVGKFDFPVVSDGLECLPNISCFEGQPPGDRENISKVSPASACRTTFQRGNYFLCEDHLHRIAT
jgi:hypothetical protein